ncbi:IclR family transcriptional regulator [Arthrobacter sp. TMN-37]
MTETQDTSAAKMLAVLEALAQSGAPARSGAVDQSGTAEPFGLTVAELSRVLEREKSIVSRQLKPLVELGLVERGDDGRHRLGWRLFAVAAQAGDQRLLLLAPPVMRELTRLLRECVHLSIRRNTEVLTILSERPHRAVEAAGWVGRNAPISCTSSGRALLFDHRPEEIQELLGAHFFRGPGPNAPASVEEMNDRVIAARTRGYALAVDEFDEDLTAVAAPVRDVHGRIVAALNVSAPSYRLRDSADAAGRHVSRAAAYLSRALSAPPAEHPPGPASAGNDNPNA